MTKKQPSNFVKAIANEFGPHLTNFSRALGMPHATVDNWQKSNFIPVWRNLQIMEAAKKAKLSKVAKAKIKHLLDEPSRK